MKLIFNTLLFLVLCLSANAQYDPEARAILDAMSAKYKNMNAFSANFTQTMTNAEIGIDEAISGSIIVKGDKYVLKVSGQEIINDGTDLWSYNQELAEVTVSRYEEDEQEISLGNVYDIYKKGFKYNLIAIQGGNKFVELDPIDRNKSYFKIKMVIKENNELKEFTVMEKTGNVYTYTIKDFAEKPSLTDAGFKFDEAAHPEVEIIDFR